MSRQPNHGQGTPHDLASFLAIGSRKLEDSEWLMYSGERLALAGLLAELKPARSLEVGCWRGGSTRVLSRYSGSVVSIDVDDTVEEIAAQFPNVTAVCADSSIALRSLRERNERFDFALIDADHSREGVRGDLTQCLQFADVILLHDTANPDCRAGILDALAGASCYYDLDLLAGGLQPEGLWGDLGLCLLNCRAPHHGICRRA